MQSSSPSTRAHGANRRKQSHFRMQCARLWTRIIMLQRARLTFSRTFHFQKWVDSFNFNMTSSTNRSKFSFAATTTSIEEWNWLLDNALLQQRSEIIDSIYRNASLLCRPGNQEGKGFDRECAWCASSEVSELRRATNERRLFCVSNSVIKKEIVCDTRLQKKRI